MTPLPTGDGVVFGELRSRELADARAEVLGWAEELFADQREAHAANRRMEAQGGAKAKPAATLAECRAKSIEIRRKRERDATYWNQLTNPNPTT